MKITSASDYDQTTRTFTFAKRIELDDADLCMLRRIGKFGKIRSKMLTEDEFDLCSNMEDARLLRTDPNDWHTTFYLTKASIKILSALGSESA